MENTIPSNREAVDSSASVEGNSGMQLWKGSKIGSSALLEQLLFPDFTGPIFVTNASITLHAVV